MKELFDATSFECSKLITKAYSTSFSLGIQTLDKKLHEPIYAIYGFVRYADEIVDTFHDYDKATLLNRFREDAYKAIEEGISMNPILHSFQAVVNQYDIDRELIDAFLYSMEMDLDHNKYDERHYHKYIYGSAEVVGLMCLKVFCNKDQAQYDKLKEAACALGSAFQKVNFLRDMKSDFEERGRVYFPGVDFTRFTKEDKSQIEKDIEQDFEKAYHGILNLPSEARSGVYLAYIYYVKLFDKIRKCSTKEVKNQRIRVPDFRKALLLVSTYLRFKLKVI
ncbi:phytoene/squalene synthase family protein [Limibacter armeniacum]|uniref:phytoene/squalene synthase family protein n=1 Tax=Limibacter armeniacum TaxID=466084 RepID=UPI002FE50DFA